MEREMYFPMKQAFRRAEFLGAGAAFVAVPGRLRAQTPAKIRMAASGAGEDIAVALWAVQSGLFQKYGLDVDVSRLNNSASVTAAVLGGALDIGKASLFGIILARGKGLPIVLEAAAALYSSSKPDTAMVVAKDSPIQNARDLNRKTIASASLGDLFTLLNSAWIDQNGGDSHTVKYLELPAPALADALVAGRVDAGSLPEPTLTDAVRSGKCRIIGYPNDVIGKLSVVTAYFCTTGFAAQNVAALRRFRKAMDESVAYVKAHQDEMNVLVAKYTGVDLKKLATKNSTLATSANLLDARLTQPTIDIAAKYNAIPKAFPARDMIDPNAFSAAT
jgi:NitT/TauT family transport system substrate-binding protein